MIYLDYAANTPPEAEVLEAFCSVSKEYIANPNSNYLLGVEANNRLRKATEQIASLLGTQGSEIIYTSGATESNNLAIKGVAGKYKKYGRHIITTFLEHSSVTGPAVYLQNQGFEVDYVDVLPSGLLDLEHLKELLREDTILVSVCWVDSEIGIKQDIERIAEVIKPYKNCVFHVDATQAVGKIPVSAEVADLISFAPHKFYGLNGCGVLIKKENILLEPQIHGGISTTAFRSGTPALANAVAAEKALSLAVSDMDRRYEYVSELNRSLKEGFKKYSGILINSTENSIPFILNLSIKGVKSEIFQKELEGFGIYVATKSACCVPNTVSRPVYALTKDRKAALSTLRISLSHLTSKEDVEFFLDCFDKCYKKVVFGGQEHFYGKI